MTRLVSHFGGVWRISEVSYTRLLRAIATNEYWDLDEMGTHLGDVTNITDLSPDEAAQELLRIKTKSRASHRVSVRDAGPQDFGKRS